MIDFGTAGAQICVVGRTAFGTGMGAVAYGTAETLARNFPVVFRPIEPEQQTRTEVELPNGRVLGVLGPKDRPLATVFCDVVANGVGDFAWGMLPSSGMVYAWLLFDSDRLPPLCVHRLNARADIVLAPSAHLVDVARRSGVERPITVLPIPLDIDALLARPAPPPAPRWTVGSISAFHPRKGHETLVEAFLSRFAGDETAELVLHSNLAFGATLERVRALAGKSRNVRITTGELTPEARNALLASFDVFASCSRGEGYGIGPREALAVGKMVVASAVGGHGELDGIPGVFLVEPTLRLPARYPEIDNLVFGEQQAVRPADMAEALVAARQFDAGPTAVARREAAQRWTFASLASSVGALIDPSITAYRPGHCPGPDARAVIEQLLGRRGDRIGGLRRQVCPAYDAGFFSMFNSFISHFVWQEREDRCHAVLPDWDVDRLIARFERDDASVLSFCYGQPGDGNLWLKLFQPLLGASPDEMQDEAFLWRHAEAPFHRHNEDREPNLTFLHAYTLYQSEEFERFRRQYHRVFSQHVRLRPELAAEIETFARAFLDVPIRIAAHVRHPSHTVEQPGQRIAHTEAYVQRVQDEVRRLGGDPDGGGWAVFVATDQARVLDRFREAFGARAVFYPEARRTRAEEDARFDALSPAEQNRDGHQLQHLVAADRAHWHWRMAWEVVRDAYTMARCQTLLHVVSNVSTAVAYMNPDLEMIFCQA